MLRRTTFDHRHRDGHWSTEQRETHDRADGTTVLPCDADRRTVLLTRQFRFPARVAGCRVGELTHVFDVS